MSDSDIIASHQTILNFNEKHLGRLCGCVRVYEYFEYSASHTTALGLNKKKTRFLNT